MKDYTLPFVPLTLQEIAEEKIALSGAVETASDEEADYISSFTAARTARKITVPWPTG